VLAKSGWRPARDAPAGAGSRKGAASSDGIDSAKPACWPLPQPMRQLGDDDDLDAEADDFEAEAGTAVAAPAMRPRCLIPAAPAAGPPRLQQAIRHAAPAAPRAPAAAAPAAGTPVQTSQALSKKAAKLRTIQAYHCWGRVPTKTSPRIA
jgi:translation initiation factor IF-2